MIYAFPIEIGKSQAVERMTTDNMFKVNGNKPLSNNKAGLFHTKAAGGFFL